MKVVPESPEVRVVYGPARLVARSTLNVPLVALVPHDAGAVHERSTLAEDPLHPGVAFGAASPVGAEQNVTVENPRFSF